MPSKLFGSYYVKPTPTAVSRAWKLCQGSAVEYQKLRRHGLKLAFHPNSSDWDWIKSLPGERIGELRIDEDIAQQTNIRVIFFKTNVTLAGDPMARIWPMTVFPKKAQHFSPYEIKAFKAMKTLIVERVYGGNPAA